MNEGACLQGNLSVVPNFRLEGLNEPGHGRTAEFIVAVTCPCGKVQIHPECKDPSVLMRRFGKNSVQYLKVSLYQGVMATHYRQ